MQKKTLIALASLAFMAASCSEAETKQAVQPEKSTQAATLDGSNLSGNCTDPEYRQLDFWVGEWDLTWAQPDGTEGHGSNTISHDPYGNCVIMENFDGAPSMQFKGMSVSTYLKPVGLWRQAWVDDQGSFFSLYGGPQEDGTFKLDMERVNDKGPHRRMIWKNIEADSLVWHWQGKTDDDPEWTDAWVINYKRKK